MKKAILSSKPLILVSTLFGFLLLSPFRVFAQPVPGSVLGSLWTDGIIYAVAPAAGKVYVGGAFANVGYSTGPWLPISTSSATTIAGYPEVIGASSVVWASA